MIASNNSESKFRVLKIDRLEPKELTVIDDKVEYSRDEIRDLISMIDTGNRGRAGGAVRPDVSAFGVVGELPSRDQTLFSKNNLKKKC